MNSNVICLNPGIIGNFCQSLPLCVLYNDGPESKAWLSREDTCQPAGLQLSKYNVNHVYHAPPREGTVELGMQTSRVRNDKDSSPSDCPPLSQTSQEDRCPRTWFWFKLQLPTRSQEA